MKFYYVLLMRARFGRHKNSLPNYGVHMWEKQHKKSSATVCAPSELYSLIVLWLLNNNNMSSLSLKRLRRRQRCGRGNLLYYIVSRKSWSSLWRVYGMWGSRFLLMFCESWLSIYKSHVYWWVGEKFGSLKNLMLA